ncbi:YbfB/YjiJ family MFS transporter, partial [Enterobacter roggenkampii]|uniref:YbfB/YjiJ family MFS transporter n=1 Tax=Enterobacter roggenkampii TaxID=1812935 RepID=UPI003D6EABC8
AAGGRAAGGGPGFGGPRPAGRGGGGAVWCAVQLSLLYGRELAPNHTRYMAGLLTTGYAIGQLIGPVTSALSTWLTHRLEPALGLAGIALFVGGALVWNRHAERQQQSQ